MRINRYLWVSLGLHFIFLLGLNKSALFLKAKKITHSARTPVEVTVVGGLHKNPKAVVAKDPLKAVKRNGFGDPKSLANNNSRTKNLFGTTNTMGSLLSQMGQSDGDGYTLHDNPTTAWGSGGGDFARVQDFSLMKRLYSDVEAKLFYPSILAGHQISGVVNSRLVFNENGDCDFTSTQISSSESHLRIYVLSLLKKVCHQNYAHYIGKRTLTNVDMSFLFQLTEHNDSELTKKQEFIVGNVLNFQRNSHQSVAEWKVGPFTGMFPIPMVNIDFSWLEENWEKVVEGHDPMNEYRN